MFKTKFTTVAGTLLGIALVLLFWNPISIGTSRDDKDRTLQLKAEGSTRYIHVKVSVRSSTRGMLRQTDREEDTPWEDTIKVLPAETIAVALEVWAETEAGWSRCQIIDGTKPVDADWAQVKFPSRVAYTACSYVAR